VLSNHVVGLHRVMGWDGGTGLRAVMWLHTVMGLLAVMWLRRGAAARHVHVVGSGQDVHPDDPGNDRQQPCQQARAAQEQSCAVRQGRGQVFLLPCRMGYFKSTGHAALAQLLDHGCIPPLPAGVLLARETAAAFCLRLSSLSLP
jgi:hypothetical protein